MNQPPIGRLKIEQIKRINSKMKTYIRRLTKPIKLAPLDELKDLLRNNQYIELINMSTNIYSYII